MSPDRVRGSLVSKCWSCGTLLRRASPEQHAVLQGVLEDLAVQLLWDGMLRGVSTWWQLIVAAYDRLKKEEAELLPSLDGQGFDGNGMDFVRGDRRRRHLNDHEISEIIEYARAFGVEKNVRFREFEKRAA